MESLGECWIGFGFWLLLLFTHPLKPSTWVESGGRAAQQQREEGQQTDRQRCCRWAICCVPWTLYTTPRDVLRLLYWAVYIHLRNSDLEYIYTSVIYYNYISTFVKPNIGFCAGETGLEEAGCHHGKSLQTSNGIHVKEELNEDFSSADGEYIEACVVKNGSLWCFPASHSII